MLKKASLLLILSLMLSLSLMASNSILTGKVKNAGDMQIRIFKYSDYISMNLEQIAAGRPDEDGHFELKYFLAQPELLTVKVGFKQATYFAQPGQKIQAEINYASDVDQPGGSLPLEEPLDFIIPSPKDSSVNHLIFQFDSLNGELFPEKRIRYILYKRDIDMYDSLKTSLLKWVESVRNPYIDLYAEYRLGQFESVLIPGGLKQTGQALLANRKIHYRHPGYMNFLKNFVKSYVPSKSPDISPREIASVLNDNPSYEALDDTLGQDTVFRNEQIRELSMIILMHSAFYDSDYSHQGVFKILNEIIGKTKFKRHRQIAARVRKQLKAAEKSKELKDYTFKIKTGKKIRISDYQGRYFLLNFFSSDCLDCLLEMDVMKKLYKEKSNDIYLLSVSLDDSFKAYRKFVRENDYQWDIAYFDKNYDMIRALGLKTIPHFMLIDPDGNIIDYRFPNLSEGGLRKINNKLRER